jgi:hypothetical protein
LKAKDTFRLKISYLEIYNENVNDLLCSNPSLKNLEVRESIQGVYIQGLTEIETKSAEEALEYLEIGES